VHAASFRAFVSVPCFLALLVARSASADEERPRPFFRPSEPIALVALSAGAGGFGAGSATDAKGQVYGYGGVANFAARLDLEAASPVWLSLAGRAYVGTPAEADAEASVGYELRFEHAYEQRGVAEFERLQLRPLAGVKMIRFADSPLTPTSAEALAVRSGLDATLVSTRDVRGFNVMRAHLVVLWDVARGQAGVEFSSTAGISVDRRVLGGPFIGASIGYLPSTGAFGSLDLGAAWEVGTLPRSRR
jgi:hypothetical protein